MNNDNRRSTDRSSSTTNKDINPKILESATTTANNDGYIRKRERSTSRTYSIGSGSIALEPTTTTTSKQVDYDHIYNEFMILLSNKQYIYLVISFSVGLGLINSVLTLIYQLVEPYGYSNNNAGFFGFILIVSGMYCTVLYCVV